MVIKTVDKLKSDEMRFLPNCPFLFYDDTILLKIELDFMNVSSIALNLTEKGKGLYSTFRNRRKYVSSHQQVNCKPRNN